MVRTNTGTVLIGGTTLDFMVSPSYTMYRQDGSRIPDVWNHSPQKYKQRPAFWSVTCSLVENDWIGTHVHNFKTRKAAVAVATQLAQEDKTLALLKNH